MSKKNLKINYFSNILNINQLEKGCIIQKIIYVKKDEEYNNEKKRRKKLLIKPTLVELSFGESPSFTLADRFGVVMDV